MTRKEVNEMLADQIRDVGETLAKNAAGIAGDIPFRTGEFEIDNRFTGNGVPQIEYRGEFLTELHE